MNSWSWQHGVDCVQSSSGEDEIDPGYCSDRLKTIPWWYDLNRSSLALRKNGAESRDKKQSTPQLCRSDCWLPRSSAHEQVFTCFTHWLYQPLSSVWEKEFLVNLWAWVAYIREPENIALPKSVFQFEDILKMFMVTCCTSVWKLFPKSPSEWMNTFLSFLLLKCKERGPTMIPGGSSEPSTKPQKQTQKEGYPIRVSVDDVLKSYLVF